MCRRTLSFLTVLCLVFQILPSRAMGGPSPPPAKMEKYKAVDNSYALYKPKGWNVDTRAIERGKAVTVSEPGGRSFVVMKVLTMDDRKTNTTALANRMMKELRPTVSGLSLMWARSTKDLRRTVMEIRYTNARNVPMMGRYYFNTRYPDATVFGYEAPEAEIERLRPTLLSVLTNFTILDPSGAGKTTGATATGATGNPDLRLEKRTAQDGSFTILVPRGWNLQGAKGQAFVTTPGDGIAGFASIPVTFWGHSAIGFDSSRIPGVIHSPYARPADALVIAMRSSGSRNHRILGRSPENAKAREYSAALRQRVEVETTSIVFDSKSGVRCQGFYEVAAIPPLPSGQWSILVVGVWAPQKDLPGYLPSLERIADSYNVNQRFAAEYVRRGNENLRRLARQTSEKIAKNSQEISEIRESSYRERQKSQDYIDYKRTGAIRGEQEWVSEVEGGAIYKSDHWGLSREGERKIEGQDFNYYNYKGDNPKYNEKMTPVDSSREVYESVYGK